MRLNTTYKLKNSHGCATYGLDDSGDKHVRMALKQIQEDKRVIVRKWVEQMKVACVCERIKLCRGCCVACGVSGYGRDLETEEREGGWTKEKGNEKSVDELGEKK